jgi:hypothetical protein
VLPVLTDHLLNQGYKGKVLVTVTGSRLIDAVAAAHELPQRLKPDPDVIPAYIAHSSYEVRQGDESAFRGLAVFVVPVGIKYVIEGMLVDNAYHVAYGPGFRETLLIGGEESSGLTTAGHVPDKDGIWGNLLVMQLMASEGAGVRELWRRLQAKYHASWFERTDVDASEPAKERLLNHFLLSPGLAEFAGLRVHYVGGVLYDLVEVQLSTDGPLSSAKPSVFLEVRASGTEPLNRIYVEAPDEVTGRKVRDEVLALLDRFSVDAVLDCRTDFELTETLAVTPRSVAVEAALKALLARSAPITDAPSLARLLRDRIPHLEHRNQLVAQGWCDYLDALQTPA